MIHLLSRITFRSELFSPMLQPARARTPSKTHPSFTVTSENSIDLLTFELVTIQPPLIIEFSRIQLPSPPLNNDGGNCL